MSNLFKTTAAKTQVAAAGVNIQTSVYGKAIPIVYGTTRVAGNLILYGNFEAIQVSSGSSGGGKGGAVSGALGKGGSGSTTYDYRAAFAFALCEGPIQGIGLTWADKSVYTLAQLGFTLFYGTYPQLPWGTTVTWDFTDDSGTNIAGTSTPLGYNGFAYVADSNYDLGSSTSSPNLNFEVQGILSNSVAGQQDADPSQVITDFLTNTHYGVGFPAGLIGDLTAFKNYCIATGLLISPAYTSQTPASNMIDEICTLTNSAAVWSNGLLRIVPYGDQPIAQGAQNVAAETHTITQDPTTLQYSIKVAEAATFIVDQGVTFTVGGTLLTRVNSYHSFWGLGGFGALFEGLEEALFGFGLASGQYFVGTDGTYYFSQADNGKQVTINYLWASAASYNPPTPIYDLTDDDFMAVPQGNAGSSSSTNSDPVLLVRKRQSDKINSVSIEYLDRVNNYNPAIIIAEDQGSIDAYGKRTNGSQSAHMFTNAVAATLSANLQLRRNVYVCNTYQFDLDQRYSLLEPMDIVTLTDANLGLNKQWVRITEINENDNGTFSFAAEEVLNGVGSSPAYSFQTGAGFLVNYNAQASNVQQPIIFEPTDELGGGLEIWLAVTGQGNWGGAYVWVSYDGNSYSLVGKFLGGSRMGVTTNDFLVVPLTPNAQTIDTTHILGVDLTVSDGSLQSGTTLDATSLNTACYVGPVNGGGEIIAYQTATLTAANKYNLSYLVRGAFGTEDEIIDHPAGSYFARLDNGIVKFPFDQSRIGSTISIKFQSFNQFGGGTQNLSDVAPYTYVIKGSALASPLPDVTNLYSNYEAGFQKIYWDEITDFRSGILYEIRQGASWDAGQFIRTQAHPPFICQGNGTFWIKARCQPIAGLTVYSENAEDLVISGNQLSLNLLAGFDEKTTGWTGTFDNGLGFDSALNAIRIGGGGNLLPVDVLESLTTSAATASGNVLTFASVPGTITIGLAVVDTSRNVIPANTTVTAVTSTTVTLSNPVFGGGVLNSDTIVFSIADILNFGGLTTNTPLHYTIPNSHIINAGSVVQASINSTIVVAGIPTNANLLSESDVLSDPDILQSQATQFVDAWVEINVSQDGVTFAGWQKFVPGVYPGMAWDFRVALETESADVICYVLDFSYQVQLPARVDHYQNESIASGGTTITFERDGTSTPAAFNGGPAGSATPYVSVSWQATSGDIYVISALSLSSMTIQFKNGGVGVARTANIDVEGY